MIWSSLGRMAGEEEISVKEHLKSGEALSELLKRTKYISPEQAFAWMKPVIKQAALEHEICSNEDFKALLSPAAEPFLEQMARRE